MKIIRFLTSDPASPLDFHPDSALLLPGRPMFYPGFGDGWTVSPVMAVRINRLGKCVAVKFAGRYYDAVAPAVRLVLPGMQPEAEGELSGMDFSITHGDWAVPEEFLTAGSLEIGGVRVAIPYTLSEIDPAVSRASRLTTIKMGDILLLPLTVSDEIQLIPRSRLKAVTPAGVEVMNVKVV